MRAASASASPSRVPAAAWLSTTEYRSSTKIRHASSSPKNEIFLPTTGPRSMMAGDSTFDSDARTLGSTFETATGSDAVSMTADEEEEGEFFRPPHGNNEATCASLARGLTGARARDESYL